MFAHYTDNTCIVCTPGILGLEITQDKTKKKNWYNAFSYLFPY